MRRSLCYQHVSNCSMLVDDVPGFDVNNSALLAQLEMEACIPLLLMQARLTPDLALHLQHHHLQ